MVKLAFIGVFCFSVQAFGSMERMKAFKMTYPDVKAITKCTLCHTQLPQMNPYGADLELHKNDLAAIEQLDSDGDTFINLIEINNGTFPGDKDSKPSETE